MANRTLDIPGAWASGAGDTPGTPVPGTTYKKSTADATAFQGANPYGGDNADSALNNEVLYRLTALMMEQSTQGVLTYCATTIYVSGAIAMGSNGVLYQSLVGSNIGHDPTSSPTYWQMLPFSLWTLELGTVAYSSATAFTLRNPCSCLAVDHRSKAILSLRSSRTAVS